MGFVAGLSLASDVDRKNAAQIEQLLTTINQPETFKNWYVGLNLFDITTPFDNESGISRRSWWISFEKDNLEIEAKTTHTDDPIYHYGEDFYYSGLVNFNPDLEGQRIYLEQDPATFVHDAMHYQKYLTDTLNYIEVDIDVEG